VLEALEWDGVDWTGEIDEDGVEIGLIDDDWDIPDDLEVVETTRDPEVHFASVDRVDAGVWDEDMPSSAGLSASEWDEDSVSEEGSYDAFKALVESEKGAPARNIAPKSANNTVKYVAVGVAVLLLFAGTGALAMFGVAGIGAVVAGTSGSPDEAMVVIEDPVPEAPVPVVDEPTEDELLDEELEGEEALEEEVEDGGQPQPRRRAPAPVEEVPEPEPEPVAEAPEPAPEPPPAPVVGPEPTGKKGKKKKRGKKGK